MAGPLLHVPLDAVHRQLGGQMVPFGGYEMPVRYASIQAEHEAVRQRAGLFDVSHMGNLWVRGPEAESALSLLTTADASKVKAGGTKYTTILREDGTIIDDTYLFRTPDAFHVVPNAGMNRDVLAWFQKHAPRTGFEDASAQTCILALQGPLSPAILQPLTDTDLAGLKPFRCTLARVAGAGPFLLSRTGYTGEDGFELFPPAEQGRQVWDALMREGQPRGLLPCGLGARDTLRLEKGYCLAGHEFAGGRTPLEASLDRFVDWDHEFLGKESLEVQRNQGLRHKLVGLVVEDRGIPRQGCGVRAGPQAVGEVTSGTLAPTLRKGIALAYVQPGAAVVGTVLDVVIRDRPSPARVTEPPFVK
jgi:aminomethyltransferase